MMTFLNPRLSILSLLVWLTSSAASAQTLTQPLGVAPQPFGPPSPGVPSFSQTPPPPLALKQVSVSASALFSESNEPIRSGL
ncbi:MAG TPA: hypothetical protein VFF61_01820, partial [Microvirga sp.]|nr:hypothetical protein [Microvirga sp.]